MIDGERIIEAAVFAGGFYVWIRLSINNIKKDMAGIGSKLKNHQEKSEDELSNHATALMLVSPEKDRQKVAELLRKI